MAFKIEKGVAIPTAGNGGRGGRPAVYPFREMEIGDSIFFPLAPEERRPRGVTIAARAWDFSRRNPEYNFTKRVVDGGVRIWRIPAKEAA